MRYYVEINGESSLDIQGLMIQSLPSISKPLMRSKQETIDGRDGDIVTKLGYSAYDKTLKIGLWGNYDINEVIAFFNQEGTITFSNEPDKYYRFTILNRDDYVSQLDKFRTCTIALHCQPYKYKLNEEAEELENEYVEQEGTSLTFTNTLEAPMNIDLKGNTLQNGTPTPNSPIPINVVSGDNDVVVYGKNLLKNQATNTSVNGITYTIDSNGGITANGTATALSYILPQTQQQSPLYEAGNYTFSLLNNMSSYGYVRFEFYKEDRTTRITRDDLTNGSTTITLNEKGYLRVSYIINSGASPNNFYNAIQVEQGNRATSFMPYDTTTYNIDLPEGMELSKIGTYQDYIYKDSGKWYLHKEIGKVVFDGSENDWSLNQYGFFQCSVSNSTSDSSKRNGYCNNFTYAYNTSTDNTFFMVDNLIRIRYNTYDNTTSFKTWLSTNNTSVYYVLETPTNTEITYTPLIEQLNAIEQAQSKNGTTNITQVNNDLPFIITASVLSGTDSITLTNEGNATSKPTLTITGSGVVGVYLENIQIFNISLGTNETIIIDTENMEAYYGSQLKNRQVTGDYSNFALQSGTNNLKFTGVVTNVEITNYNRWI